MVAIARDTVNCLEADTLPYSSLVSKVTVAVKVSLGPLSLISAGTRHAYPQVSSQPKGMLPSANFRPSALVMSTEGFRRARLCRDRSELWA